MIKVQDALDAILKNIKTLGSENVKLTSALGRVLAEDIYADVDIPAFDNSAMDGYAVKAIDTKGASLNKARVLHVIDDIRAGYIGEKTLRNNQAIRIMTGAPVPKGADSVIMVENTEKIKNGEFVQIFKCVRKDENIRGKGEDIRKGELVIKKGTLLNPAHIGVLASLGRSNIKVTRKPKVAILATGDEIIDVDKKLAPGKVRSSNTYTLCAQVLSAGAIPKNLGIVKDVPQKLIQKIKQGFDCDAILTSGGVSVGEYDFVKHVLKKLGTHIKFWKVAMRPGKPLVFGRRGNIPIFGLPGNPVSSMISFEIFARPSLLKMLGQVCDGQTEAMALLEHDIKKKKGLRYFLRAKTYWKNGAYFTRTTGPQGSAILKSMAHANSLIILPERLESAKKGTKVKVRFLGS